MNKGGSSGLGKVALVAVLILISLSLNPLIRVVFGTDYPVDVVVSGSMRPTLEVGDIVVVKAVDPSEIRVGDVIVFHDPIDGEKLIVHRVVDVVHSGGKYYFDTKGDANFLKDSQRWGKLVSQDLVEGKVVFVIPKVGLLRIWLDPFVSSGFSYVIVIVLLLLLFLIWR